MNYPRTFQDKCAQTYNYTNQSVFIRPLKSLVRSPARPIFFPRTDDSHCNRILTAVSCFDNGYVGKHPVAWKEYCAEYWLKELQESMNRCTGRRDITEILLKTALNTIQSTDPLTVCQTTKYYTCRL